MNKLIIFACALLLSACASDVYMANHHQSQAKMDADLATCKKRIMHEYYDGKDALSYLPIVSGIATLVGDTSTTVDGPMSVYDLDKFVTRCMHEKGYSGESN